MYCDSNEPILEAWEIKLGLWKLKNLLNFLTPWENDFNTYSRLQVLSFSYVIATSMIPLSKSAWWCRMFLIFRQIIRKHKEFGNVLYPPLMGPTLASAIVICRSNKKLVPELSSMALWRVPISKMFSPSIKICKNTRHFVKLMSFRKKRPI